MKKLTQVALVAVAVALSAGTVAHVTPAKAEVAVTFNSGEVAYGYKDGYWDRTHAWHAWPTEQTRTTWQTTNHEHYYEHSHTEVPAQGWREEHWWK